MLFRLLALVAVLAMTVTPVLAADGDCELIRGALTSETTDDVKVCEQTNWIHESDGKVANTSGIPTWDTTAPSQSVAAGAGAGYAGVAVASQNLDRHDPQWDATFEGTFTGNIDSIAAELFLFTTARQANADQAVSLQLTIDGQTLYTTADEAVRTPLRSGGNAVQVTDFTFTDIYDAMVNRGLAVGDDVEHTVRISVAQWFSVNDNAAYVWDTTEAPSNIIFNGDLGTRIRL